jgi:DNA-binding LacI/PurR family transcriptional regulator
MLDLCYHLSSLGHRRVAYLGGPEPSWQNSERWRAVRTAGMLGIKSRAFPGDGTIGAAYSSVDTVLEWEPSALVCFNDLAAVGACPGCMSLTGFDHIEIARHYLPAITTVNTPRGHLGDEAWRLIQASRRASRRPRNHSCSPRGSCHASPPDQPGKSTEPSSGTPTIAAGGG